MSKGKLRKASMILISGIIVALNCGIFVLACAFPGLLLWTLFQPQYAPHAFILGIVAGIFTHYLWSKL